MKLNSIFKIKIIICVFFLVFSNIITSIWFNEGLMFAGGEDQLPFYNIPRAKILFTSSWQEVGTGFPQIFNLPKTGSINFLDVFWKIGLQGVVLQKIVFTLLIFLGTSSVSLLTLNIVKYKVKIFHALIISIISGLFYFLNPYSMSQIWGRGLYFQFYSFALLPISIYLLDSWMHSKSNVQILLIAYFNWILSWTYGHPANFINIILVNLIFLSTKIKDKLSAVKSIVWMLNLVFINIFWIIPFLMHGNTLNKSVSVGQDQLAIFESLSSQSSIGWVIRLMNKGNFSINSQYGDYYSSSFVVLISMILALTIISSVLFSIKRKVNLNYIYIFITGLIISLGANPPFGEFIKFIFNNFSQFQVYRNSFEKAGILMIFPLSILISYILIRFKSIKRLVVFSISCFLLFGVILVIPIWTGKFSGGEIFRPWVKIPNEYIYAREFLNSKGNEFRILQLPLLPGDGVKYNWTNYYQGIEASEFMFDQPSIGRDVVVNQDYYTALLNRFGKSSPGSTLPGRGNDNKKFVKNTLSEELNLLGVRYLILHQDIDTSFSGTSTLLETKKTIEEDDKFLQVYKNNKIIIYENLRGIKPLLSSNTYAEFEYYKSKYGYVINTGDKGVNYLELNNQYNENWRLITKNNMEFVPEKVNDFNMKWSNANISKEVILIFKPQSTYIKSLQIYSIYFLFINVVIIIKGISKFLSHINKIVRLRNV